MADWWGLSDEILLASSREALLPVSETLAAHAEGLAEEVESGTLLDRGGPDALRLFAGVVRSTSAEELVPQGHA